MRLHVRRAVCLACIGMIAALVIPVCAGVGGTRASAPGTPPQVTAAIAPTLVGTSVAPRARPLDLGFIVLAFAAFSITYAFRAKQRLLPRRSRGIRALAYGRRGPPFARV